MLKKIIVFSGLIIILVFSILGFLEYRQYEQKKAERLARLAKQAEEIKITIKEGSTIDEIAKQFDQIGMFSENEFRQAVQNFNPAQFSLIKLPKGLDLEGYLFPDTYRFSKQASVNDVIGKMLSNFEVRIRSISINSPEARVIPGYENLVLPGNKQNGLNLHQILTLASIIEQEGGGKGAASGPMTLAEERALVAGVFYNRLSIGQALESDATINYITGKSDPSASFKDLKIESAYNTYKNPGLPPGPIGNPSLGSIQAALNPKPSDYFFFLHYQPSGKVDFSKNFAEHVSKKQRSN